MQQTCMLIVMAKETRWLRRGAWLRRREDLVVLEECRFEAENQLQDPLRSSPDVIPMTDLALAEVVVVGWNTRVPARAT